MWAPPPCGRGGPIKAGPRHSSRSRDRQDTHYPSCPAGKPTQLVGPGVPPADYDNPWFRTRTPCDATRGFPVHARAAYGCAVSLEDTPHGVAPCSAVLHGGTPHGTALHSAAWRSIAPHGTTPHSTALYLSPSSSRERASPSAARRDVPAMQARACRLLDEDPCRGTGASSSLSTADFDNSAG